VRFAGAGRNGSGGRLVDGAGVVIGAGREGFMTKGFDVGRVGSSFTHIRAV
jgi:hypothetical protein